MKRIIDIDMYNRYCDLLEDYVHKNDVLYDSKIEELETFIDEWDTRNGFDETECTPLEMINSLMCDHKINQKDLAKILDVSEEHVSDILKGDRELSDGVIEKLCNRFKMRKSAFKRD